MDITSFISQRREALLIADYNTYRGQLSRQLLAIRRRLALATPKKEKFTKKPITVEDVRNNHEFIHLLLLTSERAWAHAMHIKTSHSDDANGRGVSGPSRSHIISRLNKATKIAQHLVSLLQELKTSEVTAAEKLEARAYASSLAGSVEFEKHSGVKKSTHDDGNEPRWQACLRSYSEAHVIYSALYENSKKEVFKDFLVNTIDPTIRYAAYQARLSRTIPIPTVAKRFFPNDDAELVTLVEKIQPQIFQEPDVSKIEGDEATPARPAAIPSQISWRGRKANIVDASIGQALAAVESAEARLQSYLATGTNASARDRAAAYDDVLIASQDATDTVKRATDELEKEKVDEGDSKMQDLRVTSLAVNFELISWRVGRNRILIGENDGLTFKSQIPRMLKKEPAEGTALAPKEESHGHKLIRLRERNALYDAILQSVESVKDLRGAMRDTKFVNELDENVAYFRALKCLNIAISHSIVGEHVNALALLKRANDLTSRFGSSENLHDGTDAPVKLTVAQNARQDLTKELAQQLSRTHAIVELRRLEGRSRDATAQHATLTSKWVQKLDSYPVPGTQVVLSNLVKFPPSIEPVPAKPLFLDVAWNYISYPGSPGATAMVDSSDMDVDDQSLTNGTDDRTQERKRGWFGFGR